MNLKELMKEIEKLQKKYIKEYDPKEYHFKVGDTAYVLVDYVPAEVEIVELSDFKKLTGSKDAYVYYWFNFKNISKIKKLWNLLKFKFWLFFLLKLKIKQPKIPPELGPGHGVLAGDIIFKSPEEAVVDGYLYDLLLSLEEITNGKK